MEWKSVKVICSHVILFLFHSVIVVCLYDVVLCDVCVCINCVVCI